MEEKYKIIGNYLDLKKGYQISKRNLKFFFQENRGLYNTYSKRCNEPNSAVYLGMDEYYSPDNEKVFRCFLEDLVNIGVIKEILHIKKRRKNGMH